MIRKTSISLALAALLLPARSFSLGLGEIEIASPLNQPLDAKIPLRAVEEGDLEAMEVTIGTREQFERAGLERPFVLSQMQFVVVPGPTGRAHIQVSSEQPIAEPFLNFLLEVNWPRGHVLREYTVLLDPPLYGTKISEPSPPPRAAAPSGGVSGAFGGVYRVERGDTLWVIAKQVRPDSSVSVPRMMLALLEANPEAFNNGNVNDLLAGALLRIPDRSAIPGDQAGAVAEVNRQYALWQEYRQGQLGEVPLAPQGVIASLAGLPAPVPAPPIVQPEPAAPPVEGQLRLVAAGTATEGSGAGSTDADEKVDVQSLRDELDLALEEADTKIRENDEIRERLTEAEQIIGDLQRLVQLKEDEIAALQRKLLEAEQRAAERSGETSGAQPVGTPSTAAASVTGANQPGAATAERASSNQAAQPKPGPEAAESTPKSAQPPKTQPEPGPTAAEAPKSFFDKMQAASPVPLEIFGGALAGILTLIAGLVFWRRNRAEVAAADEEGAVALLDAEPVFTEEPADVSDDNDAGIKTVDSAELEVQEVADADDPLAEVNVYLAYERFDQAEELIRGAISQYPERHEYKLKLLETFFASKNAPAFEASAREFESVLANDSAMRERANNWWAELSPGLLLFSDASAVTGVGAVGESVFEATAGEAVFGQRERDTIDVGKESTGDDSSVDFDLGFGEGLGDEAGASGATVDFDLGISTQDGGEEDAPATGSELDVSFGAPAPESAGDGTESEATLDASPAAGSEAVSDTDLDFDLGAFGDTAPQDGLRPLPERVGQQGEASELDLDLGSLDGGEMLARTDLAGGATSDGDLDVDLAGALGDASVAPDADDTVVSNSAANVGSDVAGNAGDTTSEIEFDLDLTTAITNDGALDLELDAGAGSDETLGTAENAAAGTPTAESPLLDIETVQLSNDQSVADTDFDSVLDFEIGGEEVSEAGAETASEAETTSLSGNGIFDLDADLDLTDVVGDAGKESAGDTQSEDTQFRLRDVPEGSGSITDTDDEGRLVFDRAGESSGVDEVQTKIDLAEAYIDMGDTDGAKGILDEVVNQGNDEQKEYAEGLLEKLS